MTGTRPPEQWLYIIDTQLGPWKVGDVGDFWTSARTDPETGDTIFRKDGCGAGEPQWRLDDDVLAYDPVGGRCFAIMRVASRASWDPGDDTWHFDLEFVAEDNRTGPTPESLGLEITQGARNRIGPRIFAAAERAIRAA